MWTARSSAKLMKRQRVRWRLARHLLWEVPLREQELAQRLLKLRYHQPQPLVYRCAVRILQSSKRHYAAR